MEYKIDNLESDSIKKFFESDILLSLVILFLIFKIFSVVSLINIPHISNNIFFADVVKGVLESMVNSERAKMGASPLVESEKLNLAARLKAEDMINKGYFAHISPEGATPWQFISESGYKFKYAGENLAVGFYDSRDVFEAWFDSPSHRENFMNPNYREVGTAVLSGFGENQVNIVVQLFGTPFTQSATTQNKKPAAVQPQPQEQVPPASTAATPDSTPEVLSEQIVDETQLIENKTVNYEYVLKANQFLEDFSYIFFALATGFLILLIVLNFHNKDKSDFYSRKFIFRSVMIIAFLTLSLLIDKDFIVSLIPNNIII